MERDERPAHVEVGLTASDDEPAARRWGRRRAADGSTDPSTGPDADTVAAHDGAVVTGVVGDPAADHTRRTIAIGVSGLVVGLFAGWLIANAPGSEQGASPSPGATSAPVTTQADGSAEESVETLPPAAPAPTTTRPRLTTTTTLPDVATVVLHPLVAGTDLRIVGIRSSSKLVDIDAATGEMVSVGLSGNSVDPNVLIAGDDWVITMNPNSGRTLLVGPDGAAQPTSLGDGWSLLPIAGTELFWRADPTQNGPTTRFVLVDLAGDPTGPVVSIDSGWPSGVDPLDGALVYVVQGRSYAVNEDGARLIADGELLGLNPESAVVRTCDERLRCGITVIDRETGVGRAVDPVGVEVLGSGFYYGGPSLDVLSPDGSALLLTTYDNDGPRLQLVDLETSEVEEIRTLQWGPSNAVWVSGGRALLFVDTSGVPSVYDRTTGEIAPLAEGLTGWQRIVVRP